jgi:hypothetical protein
VLLAELNIRHTRKHMPTRRVAVDDGYLPTGGPALGGVLIGAVVAEHIGGLDEEQFDALDRLVRDARHGLSVPSIALRYRLQTDTHGLDLSRHRITSAHAAGPAFGHAAGSAFGHAAGPAFLPVLELDRHGPAAPQVIGAIMAAAWLGPTSRKVALRFVETAIGRPGVMPEGLEVRRLFEGRPGLRPPLPGTTRTGAPTSDEWRGVPSERRWAMEVLGLHGGMAIERDDIQQRFRRLVRLAHPDHGAGSSGAAERIAELSEAREALLAVIASAEAKPAG